MSKKARIKPGTLDRGGGGVVLLVTGVGLREFSKIKPGQGGDNRNNSSEVFVTAESKSLQSRAAEPAQLVFQRYHAHQPPREDEAPYNDDNDSKQLASLPDRPRARASRVQ
ncbi:predicted protein [Histoplasma capsulatum var. duboisii H88]|uniref:Predicted protein n=1 Tax=Ajellomyces capsulatus (strain H88) TaxID=544711 RepID=F0UK45_AJEC8|nr:predicted protein [Histoplasma capsulatum var. duboisii H88]